MYGKNLFQSEVVAEINSRIDRLTPDAHREWGKMEVAQMLAHCSEALEMAMGIRNPPLTFFGKTIGPLFKFVYSSKKPFPKNKPTVPSLVVADQRDFSREREHLKNLIKQFREGGPERVTKRPHPFLGKMSPDQWARGMYKHLDHHLRQFGS